METPICDFVRSYNEKNPIRMHMPGHKGADFLGFEKFDITEIFGADSLYDAKGIISESEKNAGEIFGCDTYFSTEGSSHCIRTMLYLTALYSKNKGVKPLILAGRNAHKSFLSAVALLDLDVEWLIPDESSYLSSSISAEYLQKIFESNKNNPTAVYVTSPDYLGNMLDIKSISEVCHRYGVLLLVDNAHGAYLKFLPESLHPIDCGADICCDSAHKTLPVLTGGAYLHFADGLSNIFYDNVKDAFALFGSTSPSYLILQSLDAANCYLSDNYEEKLKLFVDEVNNLKVKLITSGLEILDTEPLKITISSKSAGYFGCELSEILAENNIICEFSDPDFLVLMLSPVIGLSSLLHLENVLTCLPKQLPINMAPPVLAVSNRKISVHDALYSFNEEINIERSVGRILATPCVSCPPAVPILMPGEEITSEAIEAFRYYDINKIKAVK